MTLNLKTRPGLNLPEMTANAQRDLDALAAEHAAAEQELADAVAAERFEDAQAAKARVTDVTPHLALARATLTALHEAAHDLDSSRRKAEQAEADRARQEVAEQAMEQGRAEQAEARADMDRLLADIPAALDAVKALVADARAAELRFNHARVAWHEAGRTAGHIDSASPTPIPSANVQSRIERDPILAAVIFGRI